ncbi:MFS transporter [Selenomonas sp. TAMA-11512]|uniref:MFS transporter n=1 Tax=Selenomonas sp. TAMA-11512 TaxID=3095337 RepID=UPI003084815E|nr:MFS transporter [Selenomonas sp. TAMA-11512]
MSAQKNRPVPGVPEQWATRMFFFIGGFGTASWAPLVPLFRERLGILDDVLGMLLLCIGIGSLLTMPLSGFLAARFGCRIVLRVFATLFGLLLLSLAVVDDLYVSVVCLLLFGAVMGGIDVTINIAAVIVEKASGKRLMSGMHAFWSVGGFVGAGLYGLWVGVFGLSALTSTVLAMGIIFAVMLLFSRHLIPYGGGGGGKLVAVPRGIVVGVGIVAFVSFLVEGATMDWSGVFLTTIRGWDMSLAGMGFTVFSLAMLTMRLLGDATVNKLGQKAVVIGGSALAAAGFFSITVIEEPVLIYAGFFAVGIGCANIVPVFFSLLGKQTAMPIGDAVAATSTLGYLGVLVGPAAIGFISHATSLYAAFILLAALIIAQAILAFFVYRRMDG